MSSPATALNPVSVPTNDRKMAVWAGLTSFFLMWSFLYIVLVVFRPGWVCVSNCEKDCVVVDTGCKRDPQCDQTRAFVVALIITLVVMLIVWLVAATAAGSK